MATTVLHQPQHHFGTVTGHYPSGVYGSYQGQQGGAPTPGLELPNTVGDRQSSYTSPQRWAAQQAFGRRTSKSPNIRNPTPIRHNRPEMSRHRSSSRPEMLMAFAEEQARQVQQAQPDSTRTLFVPSMEPGQPTYHPQTYAYTPVTSPYLHQQPYFDPASTSSGYAQLAPQQNQSAASMYATARHEMQLQQGPGSTLNPSETMYTQPRAQQMPAMAPVPSNFPPIPQTLESTPNEVDIVGNRQKPQCWDHGCNGRQFSTFSNLLRHQREKSGTANKARCPHCGTEFTRTTARNGHMYGGKCKGVSDQEKDTAKQEKEEEP
ncbi:hypothetical protein LTR70_001541 [Exophiala xenobiotica]|uniref:Uncharacterized protein n=1 Tax=Lithohypha guttulata TaxID=1690604 RepID=A0ABR0KDB5_9EURO|nr:hypothetical protein LTR24_004014 [Lithohypha guttulata]KAK5327918.1 hypothetical protein LTR70_001541 [Exophiala xenobiotica]